MTSPSPHPSSACPAGPDPAALTACAPIPAPARALTPAQRRAERLEALADGAAALAALTRQVAERFAAEAPLAQVAALLPDLNRGYDRLARCVRCTEALIDRLAKPVKPALDPAAQRIADRRAILRSVENEIVAHTRKAPDGRLRENLLADLYERLDDPLLEQDLATYGVGTVIGGLMADLGLPNAIGTTHPRRTRADIAALHERAARPAAANPPSRPP